MKLNLNTLGDRLQMLRKALDVSQKDIAANFQVNQNQISRFENGKGGSVEFLLDLLNYYGDHFHLNSMFSDDFEAVKKSEPQSRMGTYTSIAVEKLKVLQEGLGHDITEIITLIEKEGS